MEILVINGIRRHVPRNNRVDDHIEELDLNFH